MKTIVAAFCLLTISSTGFASTLLTCTPTGIQTARQISSIKLKDDGGKLTVVFNETMLAKQIGSTAAGNSSDRQQQPVVRVVDNSDSKNYVIDQDSDGNIVTSLSASLQSKQAVYILNSDRMVVTFLKCQ